MIKRALPTIVSSALAIHIILTALDNLPDGRASIGTRLPFFRSLPQWRFFAPNPGVENVHLFYRTRAAFNEWAPWSEFSFRNPLRWYSLAWNPRSRAPKALFDTAQQLRVLAGYGASYEWAVESNAYKLIESVVATRVAAESKSAVPFQFMIMISAPGKGREGLQPILVSQETSKAPDE